MMWKCVWMRVSRRWNELEPGEPRLWMNGEGCGWVEAQGWRELPSAAIAHAHDQTMMQGFGRTPAHRTNDQTSNSSAPIVRVLFVRRCVLYAMRTASR